MNETKIARANRSAAVERTGYAVYPPPEPGLPWLAVVLAGDRPVDAFGCPDAKSARTVLRGIEARNQAKTRPGLA